MERIFKVIAMFSLCALVFGCKKKENRIAMTPAEPRQGATISMTADLSDTRLDDARSLDARFSFFNSRAELSSIDLPFKWVDGRWKLSLTLPDTVVFMAVRLASAGRMIKGYAGPVKGKDGHQSEGALFAESRYYSDLGRQLAGQKRDTARAIAALKKEMELFQGTRDQHLAYYYSLISRTSGVERASVRNELLRQFGKRLKNETELYTILKSFTGTDRTIADSLAALMRERYPSGILALNEAIARFEIANVGSEKATIFRDMKKRYAGRVANDDPYLIAIAFTYAKQKDFNNFLRYAGQVKDKSEYALKYNALAWDLATEGTHPGLAASLAEEALAGITQWNARPPAMFKGLDSVKRHVMIANQYYMVKDTHALAKFKLGDVATALAEQRLVYAHLRGANSGVNERLAMMLAASGKAGEADSLIRISFVANKATPVMINQLRVSYLKNGGSENDFDDYLFSLKANSKGF